MSHRTHFSEGENEPHGAAHFRPWEIIGGHRSYQVHLLIIRYTTRKTLLQSVFTVGLKASHLLGKNSCHFNFPTAIILYACRLMVFAASWGSGGNDLGSVCHQEQRLTPCLAVLLSVLHQPGQAPGAKSQRGGRAGRPLLSAS